MASLAAKASRRIGEIFGLHERRRLSSNKRGSSWRQRNERDSGNGSIIGSSSRLRRRGLGQPRWLTHHASSCCCCAWIRAASAIPASRAAPKLRSLSSIRARS